MAKKKSRPNRRRNVQRVATRRPPATHTDVPAKASLVGRTLKQLPEQVLVAVIVDFIKDHVVEISNIVTGAVTKAASASAPFLSGIDPWAFAPVCKVLDEQIGQRIENMGMTDEVRERLTQLLEAELAAAVEKRV